MKRAKKNDVTSKAQARAAAKRRRGQDTRSPADARDPKDGMPLPWWRRVFWGGRS